MTSAKSVLHRYRISPWTSRASRLLLVLVIVGSVLAVGSIHVPVLLVVASVATIAGTLALAGRVVPPGLAAPAGLIAVFSAYTLLQAAPVSLELLWRLAPKNADVWARALIPLGEGPPLRASLSLDPGASWVEALRGWTYLAVFVTAAAAGGRRGAAWGALAIAASGFVLALVTIAHGVLDATRVFGVYTPRLGGQGFRIAPLIDSNNTAGYLNLSLLSGAGLLAMERPPLPRLALALALAPVAAMTLLTGSRGGFVSLGVGLSLLLVLLYRAGRHGLVQRATWRALAAAGGLVAVLALSLTIAGAGEKVVRLLLDEDVSKLRVVAQSLPMIRDHALFGIGRGAFESVFPAYHTAPDNTVFSHPENFVVQWASEWGVPAALLLMGSGVWLFRPTLWGIPRSLPSCGLFAGVAALLLQNLVDLSLEVPGVTIAVSTAAGFALGARRAELAAVPSSSTQLGAGLGLLAAGLALVTGVALSGTNTLTMDRDLLKAAIPAARDLPGWNAFKALAREVMNRHPADPYFSRIGAIAAWRSRQQSPLPWIQRALERGLSIGRSHYLLAHYLAARGNRAQTLLELRLATELDSQLTRGAARLAVRVTQDPNELLSCVPKGKAGAAMLTALASQLKDRNRRVAATLLEQAIARDPRIIAGRLTLIRWRLSDLEDGTDHCLGERRTRCVEQVERELRGLSQLQPDSAEAPMLRARLLMATGRQAEALKTFGETCPTLESRLSCIRAWIEAASRAQDRRALSQAARVFEAEACQDGAACSKVHWAIGEAALAMGDTQGALRQLERAASETPSVGRWRQVARIAAAARLYGSALRALERAAALRPTDRAIQKEIDAIRRKVLIDGAGRPASQ